MSDRPRDVEMEWWNANRARLEKEMPGKWFAIHGREVIAVGDGADDLMEQARAKGIERPLLTATRAKEYQGVIMIRRWR